MKLSVKTLSAGNLFKFTDKYGIISDLEDCSNDVIFKSFNGRTRKVLLEITELEPVIFSDIDLVNIFNPTIVRCIDTTTFCFGDGDNTITIDFNVGGNQYIEGKNTDVNITKCTKTLYIHDIQNIANAIGLDIEDKIFNYYRNK